MIAHIGSIHEAKATELGKYAKKIAYDCISFVAPFYYKFSFDEIKNYYFNLSDCSELPKLVYHFTNFSGVNMGIEQFSRFPCDERFIGIKYTLCLSSVKQLSPHKLVYNGFDEMFLAGLSMGTDGGIGSTYNFMADKFVKIRNLFLENKIEEAQKIQRQANKIITVLCKVGVMQAEKEVLNQLGFDFGLRCSH